MRNLKMSKKLFTEKEIKLLSANKYVKAVSTYGITYSDEFKNLFVAERKKGKFARDIFEECGFDVEILGMQRIKSARRRWKEESCAELERIGLRDKRAERSGRRKDRKLTVEEKNAHLEAENLLLRAELELLKKIRLAERGMKK